MSAFLATFRILTFPGKVITLCGKDHVHMMSYLILKKVIALCISSGLSLKIIEQSPY
jgi:hypothetical protein